MSDSVERHWPSRIAQAGTPSGCHRSGESLFAARCLAICLSIFIVAGAECDPSLSNGIAPMGVPPGASGVVNAADELPPPPEGATPSPAATVLEQLTLERINRARLLPAGEALRFGIALDEGIPGAIDAMPKQAVAMNTTLRRTAADHSEDMLARNYFAHDTPEGESPFDRMIRNGYVYAAAGENLAWRGTTATLDPLQTVEQQHQDLFVDRDIANRGHRVTMLDADFREVGISVQRGSFTRQEDGITYSDSMMITQDYGTIPISPVFVLGVVYDDVNRNGQYDHGEGIANTAVTLESVVKTTNEGGGYTFRVNNPGTYTLKFSIGPSQSVTVNEDDANMKIDLVDRKRLVVNLGLGKLN
ncbi:MAG: hypothetical protein H6818_16910 [Phycisphaerales bacterium]|nr:hypothetical protein [Phycisphaerales bacterium]